uniref:Uncharacterized protein n=1 Tax=Panagrolaimus sp. ES5 TaxID=591445 RepID=A0AC34FAW5_9BILA
MNRFLIVLVFLVAIFGLAYGQQTCKCVCSACKGPPTFTDPPPAPGRSRGSGTIAETISSSGCKQYTVTCNAAGTSLVSVGANGQLLSPESRGAKSAVLLCNDDKKIEGCDMDDESMIIEQVYCSNTIPVCSTCPDLPKTAPPASTLYVSGDGRVDPSWDANGCKKYTITCYAVGFNFVVIGANQDFTSLSAAGPGEKTATLTCDSNRQIEGSDVSGNVVIAQSYYCSVATQAPGGK